MTSAAVPASARTGLLRDGYAVIERFASAPEILALRAEAGERLRTPHAPACERPHNTLVPLRWDDPLVERVLGSDRRMARLRDVVDAEDLRWISGYLSLKAPRSPALWWHQDWWCWDHPASLAPEPSQVAVLCYLADTDNRNGALRVLPGSHRTSTPLHALVEEAHAEDAGELAPTHPAMSDHPGQVTLALRAGDAVVIDYRLLHGTHANATEARRDCVLLTFAPSWCALPPDIRGHLIRHPALPADDEPGPDRPWAERLLPRHDGPRRDLRLNRVAPRDFAIAL